MNPQPRTPAGSPNGGEFTAVAGAESGVTLGNPLNAKVEDLAALIGVLSDHEKASLFDLLAGQSVRGVDGHIRSVVSTTNMMVLDDDYAPAVALPAAFGGAKFETRFDYNDGDGDGMLAFTFDDGSSVVTYTNPADFEGPANTSIEVQTADGHTFSMVAARGWVDDSDVPNDADGWAANPEARQEVGLWAAAALRRAQLAESAVRYAAKDATHLHIEAIAIEEPR